jgi:hypothetical protein
VVRNAGNAAHPAERPPGSGRNEWLTPGKMRTVTSELPAARIAEAILCAERTGTVASAALNDERRAAAAHRFPIPGQFVQDISI